MSRIRTFVGMIKSFFLKDVLPLFYFFTDEMLTIKFLESKTIDFAKGYPVDKVKKLILLEPY